MREDKYHFMGIGGIGMSALAHILLDEKKEVSGFDHKLTKIVEELRKKGATIIEEPDEAVVVYSTAVQSLPQFLQLKQKGATLLHRSELLQRLSRGKISIAVTGAHGKTTTSSLFAHLLLDSGFDPSFALGGLLGGSSGINGRSGLSDYFVFEADESDGSFLNYYPTHAIVTNIEKEHLDYFKDEKRLYEAFSQFVDQVQDELFYCGDTLSYPKGTTYGFGPSCDLRITRWQQQGWKLLFDFTFKGKEYKQVQLPLIGEHNVRNGAAVFGLALTLGIDEKSIRAAFLTFPGISRRCEKRSEQLHISHYDDYAHHPTEIKATLDAVRAAVGERRVVVLYQPHRYSRMQDLLEEHKGIFASADCAFVADIYSAGEKPIEGVTGLKVANVAGASYLPKERWRELEDFLRPHDVFITMGAGDVTYFELSCGRKYRVGLVYGGKSLEHDISIRSAEYAMSALDPSLYDVERIYIDKEGRWNGMEFGSTQIMEQLKKCEVFLPILHGSYGEDGRIQSVFELLDIPYAGPSWAACALTMNKMQCKQIAAAVGVPTPGGFCFQRGEQWQDRAAKLTFPVFVKPNHLGSSIGISCAHTFEQLPAAIEKAFAVDDRVLIEEGKQHCRELEFAVVGEEKISIVAPGEKLAAGAFVDYEMKYTKGKLQTTAKPEIESKVLEQGKEYATRLYKALECGCFARVDFLLDQQNRWWFFEINPLPGMTPLSLFPRVCAEEGLTFTKLLDQMIILALYRKRVCLY